MQGGGGGMGVNGNAILYILNISGFFGIAYLLTLYWEALL